MAIVSRLVVDVESLHSMISDHNVFQCLIPGKSYVRSIGHIRWTVQKVELGTVGEFLLGLLISPVSVPPVEKFLLGFTWVVFSGKLPDCSRSHQSTPNLFDLVESKISNLDASELLSSS